MLQFNLNKGKKEKERKKERKRRRGRERNKGERNESRSWKGRVSFASTREASMPKTTTERLPPFHHPLNLRVLREDYDRLPGGMLKFPRTRESLRESSRLFQYYSSRSELFSRCARDIGTRTASVGRNIFFLIISFFFFWN